MIADRETNINRKSKYVNNLQIPYCKTRYEQRTIQYQRAIKWNCDYGR